MIPGIVAGGFAGEAEALALVGALVRKNAGQTIGTTLTSLTFQVEPYDVGGFHDTVSNTARLTIPSGQGIDCVRLAAGVRHTATNNPNCRIIKNGAVFHGMGNYRQQDNGTNLGYFLENLNSAIVEVADADYFESQFAVNSGTTSPNDSAHTFFAIEVIDPSLRRVLARKTSNQAVVASVPEELTWDTTEYNVGSWTVSAEHVTVPFTGRVRMSANVLGSNVTGRLFVRFLVNGASVPGAPNKAADVSGTDVNNAVSAVLEVTTGDELSVEVTYISSGNITAGEQTWFCVEEVPSDYTCVLLKRTSGTQTITNADTPIEWQSAVYEDETGLWDVSAPTVVVAPFNGYFRQTIGILGSSAANECGIWGDLEGATYYGSPGVTFSAGGSIHTAAVGAWAPCLAGDEIRAIARSITNRTIGTDDSTFMGVEFRAA